MQRPGLPRLFFVGDFLHGYQQRFVFIAAATALFQMSLNGRECRIEFDSGHHGVSELCHEFEATIAAQLVSLIDLGDQRTKQRELFFVQSHSLVVSADSNERTSSAL